MVEFLFLYVKLNVLQIFYIRDVLLKYLKNFI